MNTQETEMTDKRKPLISNPNFRITKKTKKGPGQVYNFRRLSTGNYQDDAPENPKKAHKENLPSPNEKSEIHRRRANRSILKTPSIGIKALLNQNILTPTKDDKLSLPFLKQKKGPPSKKGENDFFSKNN